MACGMSVGASLTFMITFTSSSKAAKTFVRHNNDTLDSEFESPFSKRISEDVQYMTEDLPVEGFNEF